ncbi:ligase-associated DNA damage response endonuclease PdeM [Palleronia pelagia]|uniref:Putative phosphoesterase n=1 Tax=Palleronia pelagia TaxID=387096 RepID=A0A1H8JCG6_9RHOB|nr:ligase-associated DNA damage response endonuclease PdeM [Palleronia pelagia]SEN78472.1 putative phosphoesterase [Palleronia pelagia]
MNFIQIDLCGARLHAHGSGALHWPEEGLLVVSDLHLGKSERIARRAGQMLPPYETRDTLARLEGDVAQLDPARVICLGDSLDDDAATAGLDASDRAAINRMQGGRDWTWIAGNHDPAPSDLGGNAAQVVQIGPLLFRHIATPARGEITGHYHPKARLGLRGKAVSRPCFLVDRRHMILPAYGTFTGGLCWRTPHLRGLMGADARAVLTGPHPAQVPLPRMAA